MEPWPAGGDDDAVDGAHIVRAAALAIPLGVVRCVAIRCTATPLRARPHASIRDAFGSFPTFPCERTRLDVSNAGTLATLPVAVVTHLRRCRSE